MEIERRTAVLKVAACLVLIGVLSAAGTVYAQSLPDELEKAVMLFRSGNNDGAIAEIDRVLASGVGREEQARALACKAGAETKKGDIEGAIRTYGRIAGEYADLKDLAADAQLRIGYLHLKRGDTRSAIGAFEKVAAFGPTDKSAVSDAKYRLAVLKQKRAKGGEITWEEAKSAAEDLLTSFPDDAKTQNVGNIILAEIAFERREYGESVDQARLAITKYPHGNAPGNFVPFDLTTSYANQGVTDQAGYAKLFIGLAYAVREPYYLDAAIESFREVLSSYPGTRACAEAQYRIGEALFKLAKYDEAMVELDKVLSGYPSDETWRTWAVYRKGYCLAKLSQLTMACAEWDSVLESLTNQPVVRLWSELGVIEFRTMMKKEWAQAAERLEELARAYPQMKNEVADARRLLMSCYYKLKQHDDTIRVCGEVAASYPDGGGGWYGLLAQYHTGLSHSAKGETGLATAAFVKALGYQFNAQVTPSVRIELAKVYAGSGDTAMAVEQLDAIKADARIGQEQRAEALYKKGLYLTTAGDKTAARDAFEELTKTFGESYLSARAAEKLAQL
jgi:tetratricopeptide (TPR) repeat protein